MLSSVAIRPSEHIRGFLSIGHSEDWDMIQRPGQDEVFITGGEDSRELEKCISFPTVYHSVLDELDFGAGPVQG